MLLFHYAGPSRRKERKPENKGLGLSLQLLAVFDDSVSLCSCWQAR